MTQEFYITLPSNVKSSFDFSYNMISSFNTKLHRKLYFNPDEDWRVGLAEISYTKSWYNVRARHQIKLADIHGIDIEVLPNRNPQIVTGEIHSVTESQGSNRENIKYDTCIKPGYYENVQALVNYINKKFDSYDKIVEEKPFLKYDKLSNRCTLKAAILDGESLFPYLGEEIENILGFIDIGGFSLYEKAQKIGHDTNEHLIDLYPIFADGKFKAPRSAELNAGSHSILVYSNIVEHNFVGDSFAQLLRLVEVPTKSNYGEQVVLRYDQPHYIPLQTHSFDTIQVELKDDTGQNIPFEFGRVIIKLIFKKYG